ncbi:MAG: hypothetical protein KGL39_41115 [Patescibacteria group bacterium]|nr:hypothetical protein [Patescibacteria group bacterium]
MYEVHGVLSEHIYGVYSQVDSALRCVEENELIAFEIWEMDKDGNGRLMLRENAYNPSSNYPYPKKGF